MGCPHLEKNSLRPELEPLPVRMQTLPVDERGFVVPWFVCWIDGKPEFRALDKQKWMDAIKFKKCWVCGGRLGRFLTFVSGPMCGINRVTSEPPSHLECAQWSARNCPFLNNPDAIRRDDEKFNPGEKPIGGVMISRNPGVAMLWTTTSYSVVPDHRGGKILMMDEPVSVEWYHKGRPATRAEILEAVETGIPALITAASAEPKGLQYFDEARQRFMKYIPL